MSFEIIRFACIGLLAMAAHFLIVAIIVPFGIPPLVANAAGFLFAFQVSYLGHSRWTFQVSPSLRHYGRLFLVSSIGFAINETCYALLLKLRWLDYRAALAVVLIAIAVASYLASKLWVFNPPEKRP